MFVVFEMHILISPQILDLVIIRLHKMKKARIGIIIVVSIILVSAVLVLAAPALVAPQSNWDPRVYDPLGFQDETTTVTSGFYNISFSISSNDNATINKILLEEQNTTNLMVYMNGSALLKPFNMQDGDNAEANLLVPIVNLQPNSTYLVEIDATSILYRLSWNTRSFFIPPPHIEQ